MQGMQSIFTRAADRDGDRARLGSNTLVTISVVLIAIAVFILTSKYVTPGDFIYAGAVFECTSIAFLASCYIASRYSYRLLGYFLLLIAILIVTISIAQGVVSPQIHPIGIFDNRNSLSYALLLLVLVVWRQPLSDTMHTVLISMMLSIVLLCGSRGAFCVMAFWVGDIIGDELRNHKDRRKFTVTMIVLLALLASLVVSRYLFDGSHGALSHRTKLWAAALTEPTNWGHGIGSFRSVILKLSIPTTHANNLLAELYYEIGGIRLWLIVMLSIVPATLVFILVPQSSKLLSLLFVSSMVDYLFWDPIWDTLLAISLVYLVWSAVQEYQNKIVIDRAGDNPTINDRILLE